MSTHIPFMKRALSAALLAYSLIPTSFPTELLAVKGAPYEPFQRTGTSNGEGGDPSMNDYEHTLRLPLFTCGASRPISFSGYAGSLESLR